MKKILTVLIFTLAVTTTLLAAKGDVTLIVKANSDNGNVYAAMANMGDESKAKSEYSVTDNSWTNAYIAAENSYDFYAFAYPKTGFYLSEWKEGNTSKGDDNPKQIEGTFTFNAYLGHNTKTITYTAIFKEQVVYKDYAHAVAVIVDNNNLQIDGAVSDVNSPYPIDKKFEAFNFEVITLDDGHDFEKIAEAVKKAKAVVGKPAAIIASTLKGKGVSFMENQVGWHGVAPNDEQYAVAMAELEKAGEALCQK